MTIPLNATIECDFDPEWIDKAAGEVRYLEAKYGDKAEDMLAGLFIVLSFMRLEKASPGTIDRISKIAAKV